MYLLACSICISLMVILQAKCFWWLRKRRSFKVSSFKGVLLVIAHPDDESMFFGPTLVSLQERGVRVKVVCLTNGTAMLSSLVVVRKCKWTGTSQGKGIAECMPMSWNCQVKRDNHRR